MRYSLALLTATAALLLCGCPRQLPIQAIILSNDNGSNAAPITLAEIDIWVQVANANYTGHGYELTFDHADVSYVKSTMLNNPPNTPENWQPDPEHGIYFSPDAMYDMFANSVGAGYPDRIVVLFRGVGGGGWSWGPPNLRYVSMPSYTHTCIDKPTPGICNPNDTLLAHEVGHYLGLAHTFWETNCSALTTANSDGDAGGQSASTTADDISDTAADPGAACAPTANLACAGGSVTVNGISFTPPWSNLMSYHDCLPESMSLDQRAAINYTLQHAMRSQIPQ